MLSDYDIIQHHFPERKDIKIYPISDVHLGAAEHMVREWESFCQRVVDEPNSYIVLGGDLVENATRNSVGNPFSALRPREQKRIMCEMLMPLKSKLLCAVQGNHERRSSKDADNDITYDIMARMDLEHLYRENIAFLKIRVGDTDYKRCGQKNPTYVLVVTHGAGGGGTFGAAANRATNFAYCIDGADALIVGHTHKPFVAQPSKIVIDSRNNNVLIRPFKVVSMTSWLNWGGYAAQQMLAPTSYAPQTITLCGEKKEIKVEM